MTEPDLVRINDIVFALTFTQHEYHVDFEVTQHVGDEDLFPAMNEKYLSGWVKWDGCTHVNVGDRGYLHLCDVADIQDLSAILERAYRTCRRLLTTSRPDWNI